MPLTASKARRRGSPAGDKAATDEDLLRRYRQSEDPAAFEELVHRYEAELYGYLHRYLGNAAMAEDTFQATFLQLHLKCGQFDEDRKVRPWLYTIATHQAIDAQRRNRRHRAVSLDRAGGDDGTGSLLEFSPSDDPDPADELALGETCQAAREAVAALPEPLRVAVHLIYYQGLKYREAADVLSIPVGTVKSRLHTAIRRLAAVIRAENDGDVNDSP